jgi:hypothetical protein
VKGTGRFLEKRESTSSMSWLVVAHIVDLVGKESEVEFKEVPARTWGPIKVVFSL